MDDSPHPSILSEILDRTILIYRRRFLVFAGLAAAPYAAVLVPVCILLLLFGGWPGLAAGKTPGAVSVIVMAVGILLAAPVWVVAMALATGGLTHSATQAYFGEGTTIRGAWNEAWARVWSYTGLYLVEVLLIWAAPVFASAIGAALAVIYHDQRWRTEGVLPSALPV